MFEDIRNTLVSISSEEALCWLIGHFLEFCNFPLSNWYVLLLIFVCRACSLFSTLRFEINTPDVVLTCFQGETNVIITKESWALLWCSWGDLDIFINFKLSEASNGSLVCPLKQQEVFESSSSVEVPGNGIVGHLMHEKNLNKICLKGPWTT
jgi:hypothetical protein